MKVLQVIPANFKNGSITYSGFIENEINSLEGLGIEVKKFFFFSRMSLKGFLEAKKKLENLIYSFEPEIIHVHTGSSTTFLVAMARKRNIPWIITFGGSELLGNHQKGFKWWMRDTISIFLSKVSARMSNGIICVSKNLQNVLPGATEKKSVVIPRGIDTSVFRIFDKAIARKELGIDDGEMIVLFSLNRTNAVVKNKELADKVVNRVREKYGTALSLVPLIGYSRNEIVLMLNAADCLLVTSLHEGSPNIVKEAMACNLPVVSVDCGDVKERLSFVKESCVEPYDESLLADSLYNVIDKRSRSNGREELLKQKIDVRNISIQIVEYYKKVAESHSSFKIRGK